MFHPIFKRKYEYFTNYFETALKNKNRSFAQSLVLYGQDITGQYYLAMEIARLLNCQKNGAYDCDCINCNWIRNNQHPAVLTITKNDNKPSDDSSSKVISIKQTLMINNSLVNSSDYYRVFIFCDSELAEPNAFQKKELENFSDLKFKFPQEIWLPKPLNRKVLEGEAPNSLLKSIEEPPERTLFLFLTEDKEDIMETIISRSQCFYVPSNMICNYDTEFLTNITADYPNIRKSDVLNIVQNFEQAMTQNGYEPEYALDCLEYYFAQLMKSNPENKILSQKIKRDILKIQHAKKQLAAYIKPGLVFEDLFFSFC